MSAAEDASIRWNARLVPIGYRDRTVREWLERWERHPELYEDLFAVVFGGASLSQIGKQRQRDNALAASRLPPAS